ncbi:hypothetical protein HYH02_013536 [Chlamydomonas schloesseri]|uniref:Uncharacterized protein n=1 Tax=Chlamydomonas schloesseri TaxID=2026947 RepID=A0A835VVM0_9CHLO|nr:hypothetical protein HYH02_013536 [Chlamydomonas schloesseri]|eukprot:KAG2431007.1 hypothetical protein HYH02_013536 [Chlamydomonas schloesseri]
MSAGTAYKKSVVTEEVQLNGKRADELPRSQRFLFSFFTSGKKVVLFMMLSPFVILWYLVLCVAEASASTHAAQSPARGRGAGFGATAASYLLPSTLAYVVAGFILPLITGWGMAPLLWLALAAVWAAQNRLIGAASA